MRALLLPLLLILSACSLAPVAPKPALPVPSSFPATSSFDMQAHAADIGWRAMFGDPRLQRLIELALENNRDLRLAALNVDVARAQYGIQRAAQLPAIDANSSVVRQRIADGSDTQLPLQLSDQQQSGVQKQYGVNIGINAFEIDLFGRLRSLSASAFARYLASDEGRLATQITLIGAVADAYFAERLDEEQLQLAKHTLTDWRQSLELAHRLREASQSSALDIAQAEGQVARAEADVEARSRELARANNALRLLLGAELPADLPTALALDKQPVVTELPAGLPSELLIHRPDIRQAEQNLVAANADIGAARAAFFPHLSLTAAMGYSSSEMGHLFDGEQRVWSFSPQLSLPVFQGGRLRAELNLAKVRTSSAVVEYERAIQIAFREVADGLAGRATYSREIAAQLRVVGSAQRRAQLSYLRYRAGVDGRLELLDAQRQLYAAQQGLLDLRRGEFSNAIALYKALGGGLIEDSFIEGTIIKSTMTDRVARAQLSIDAGD